MGLCLRRVVLQYPRLGWQVSTGISGSFQSESVATFDWNRWQGSTGISGNLRAEYAVIQASLNIEMGLHQIHITFALGTDNGLMVNLQACTDRFELFGDIGPTAI